MGTLKLTEEILRSFIQVGVGVFHSLFCHAPSPRARFSHSPMPPCPGGVLQCRGGLLTRTMAEVSTAAATADKDKCAALTAFWNRAAGTACG